MRALAGLIALVSTSASAQDAEVLRRFDYDTRAPLDVIELGKERRGGVMVHDISYASPKGGRVPAYLVVPDKQGPHAAVIWGHWYWENSPVRNRKEFLDEAIALAETGVVSLLTDGPIARPGHVPAKDPLDDRQPADLVQQIVDMRRGADLLLARKDVDAKRLAYVGHSYNATVGGFLSGIDRRFKAFVLMAGGLSNEQDYKHPEYQRYRQRVGALKFDAFVAKYAWLDPGKFVSLERAIAAAGGARALDEAAALVWNGQAKIHLPDRTLAIEGTWKLEPPDRAIVETRIAGQDPATSRTMIVSGSRGWMQREGKLTDLPEAVVEHERGQFYLYFVLRLAPLLRAPFVLDPMPPDAEGRSGFRVRHPDRPTVEVYFDESNRPRKLVDEVTDPTSGANRRQVVTLEGDITSAGIHWPRALHITWDGKPYFDLEIADLRVQRRLEDDRLAGPPR